MRDQLVAEKLANMPGSPHPIAVHSIKTRRWIAGETFWMLKDEYPVPTQRENPKAYGR